MYPTLSNLFAYGADDDENLLDYQLQAMSRMRPQSSEMLGNTFDAPGMMLAARQFQRVRDDPKSRLRGLATLADLFGARGW